MSEFWREGHYRTRNGVRYWVDGHMVVRDDWCCNTTSNHSFFRWPWGGEDFSRTTTCPRCGAAVYFVRHNGGSVWLDEMGYPWPKHPCFAAENPSFQPQYINPYGHPIASGLMGLILEVIGKKLDIRMSDNKILSGYLNSSTDLRTTLGALVVLFPKDEQRWSVYLIGSNGKSVVYELHLQPQS